MKKLFILTVLLFGLMNLQAQRGHGNGHNNGKPHGHHHDKVVIKHSPYRPHKVVVYHPYWRPNYGYNRRWVFFPRYNIYWDNWRNHYVYRNGAVWISQPQVPPVIVNVDLSKEKHKELKETEDDIDDVYRSNEGHQKAEKPE